jgi:uncharacterized membrane protein
VTRDTAPQQEAKTMSAPESHLFALAFDDEYKADEARALMKRLGGEGLIVLDQTAVVIVGLDGKVEITQDVDVTTSRRMEGHWLGIAAAAITGTMPLILAGTIAGEVIGRLSDHGITKKVMKPIADPLTPGTSALFVLARAESDEKRARTVDRLRQFNPKIVQTTVSPELKAHLEALLAEPPAATTS